MREEGSVIALFTPDDRGVTFVARAAAIRAKVCFGSLADMCKRVGDVPLTRIGSDQDRWGDMV